MSDRRSTPGQAGAVKHLVSSTLLGGLLLGLVACGGEEQASGDSAQIASTRVLAQTYLEENRLDEAEAEFRKLTEMAPDEALGHANLGLVQLRTGDLDAAEKSLRRAREIAPEQPRVNLILARLLEATDRPDRARQVLQASLEANPENVKLLYALAELARQQDDGRATKRRRELLGRIVEASRENVAARLELTRLLLDLDDADGAAAQLEQIGQLMSELPEHSRAALRRAADAARGGDTAAGLDALESLREDLEVTAEYQRWRQELGGPAGSLEGYPVLTFSRDLEQRLRESGAILDALRFTDATGPAGLGRDSVEGTAETPSTGDAAAGAPLEVADFDGDGDVELVAPASSGGPGTAALYDNDLGVFGAVSDTLGLGPDTNGVRDAVFGDVDNDGRLDLYLVRDGPNRLYRQTADGTFRQVGDKFGVADAGDGRSAIFADLDHDGDLDLYVVNDGQNRYYRNDLDGAFTEMTERAGLGGGSGGRGRAVTFGYFGEDAVLDLVVASSGAGAVWYRSRRPGRFRRVEGDPDLTGPADASVVTAGDYDNDGSEEIFVGSAGGGGRFLHAAADGPLERDPDATVPAVLDGMRVRDAEFLDFDNDGRLDLAVAGRASGGAGGVALLRNAGGGRFEDMTGKLPAAPEVVLSLAVLDYNDDGDLDLLLADGRGGTHLFRNDGGNANRHLGLRLVGLGIGSGKVNRFGIGSRVEVRVGDTRQVRTLRDPRVHVGLADERRPDFVRILWTNGVPQELYLSAGDRAAVQDQTLKGSCAFLYTWNGEETEFVKDFLWKSALGMPVGIMGSGSRSYAPPDASREYVRVPGDALEPREGAYELRVTEELWETAYVDELRLAAVDHPDSVEIFVDERFRPPTTPPEDRIYAVADPRPPAAARDGRGHDLLPELRRNDDDHVSNFQLGPYQGVAETHDLVLDPGPVPEDERLFLFLSGWVFPTDASINVALAQSDSVRTLPPRLQVRDESGEWRTVIDNISFPAGKEKTVVVELSDRYLSEDRSVRIRTNLQVYWDRAFFATGDLRAPMERTRLSLVDANLRYRGFSRTYRKGGRHGPHWFDYDSVSTTSPWLPIEGPFTRYGDVADLLRRADDRYVVAGPGDEIAVRFDTGPEVPDGWSRDFLIYSDGWIKDADLNTATGHRAGPFPYHGMPSYPYPDSARFPRDSADRAFVERTLTRDSAGSRRP